MDLSYLHTSGLVPADSETGPGFYKADSITPFVETQLTNPVLNPNKSDIFQVSINSEDQFKEYTKITTDTSIDCFIQCLFVLGLRDINEAEKDLIKLKSATVGTSWDEACNYLQHIFGIQQKIIHEWLYLEFTDDDQSGFVKKAFDSTMKKIDNGNATILTLRILNTDTKVWGHYVVAYKIKKKVYYFDPQQEVSDTNPSTDPTNLVNHPRKIFRYGFFKLNVRTRTPMPLLTKTHPITFFGGKKTRGKVSKTSKTSKPKS